MNHFVLIAYHKNSIPVCSVGILIRSSLATLDQNVHSFAERFPQLNLEKFAKGGVEKGDEINYWYFPITFSYN